MIQRTSFLILLVLCPFGPVWADDWPQWRGPERTGVSKEKGLLPSWPAKGPKLLWIFRDAGPGFSSMSVVGDRLYSMGGKGDKDCVFAIDLKTQKKLWSVEVGDLGDFWGDGPNCTPTVDGNFLYAIGSRGDLVCVEIATGRKIWSQGMQSKLGGQPDPYGYSESPLIDGELVIATPGGEEGAIAAFNKKTGTLKWRCTDCTARAAYASIIAIKVGGVRQYVQLPREGQAVVGVRASDGKLLWEFPFSEAVATPIYHKGCIFVSGLGGCKLVKPMPDGDEFKVEEIYANEEMKNHHGGVILVGKYLYGWSNNGGWMCQDFKTGDTVWNEDPKLGRGSITYADGNFYCYHEDKGDVLLIKATPDGYKENGKFRIPKRSKRACYAHPVVANGKLYLRDQDLIFCYDIRKPR